MLKAINYMLRFATLTRPWVSHIRAPFSLILRARGMPATCLPHGGFGKINEIMSELWFGLPGDNTRSQALLAQARTVSCPFLTSLCHLCFITSAIKVLSQRVDQGGHNPGWVCSAWPTLLTPLPTPCSSAIG